MTDKAAKKNSFFMRQIKDIRKGGFEIFTEKVSTARRIFGFYAMKISLTMVFIPLAIIIRVIRPLICIRIGNLDTERIGHFTFEADMYLCEKYRKLQKQNVLDIFYYNKSVSNNYLLKMWRRKLKIAPKFIMPLDWANRILPGSSSHIVQFDTKHKDLLDKLPAHLEFRPDEEVYGQEQLREMGVSKEAKYICFHSRDSAYLGRLFGKEKFSYHNYRDSNIQNYLLAANNLAAKGYYMIRMGAIVKKPFISRNAKIIDYATDHRSDFMDIYLLSKCKFFITSNSGLCAVTTIFRKPNAFVNVAPFLGAEGISRKEDLFIPKKYWSVKEKRFLTLDELLKNGVARFFHTSRFDAFGCEVIENSPEEISDLATEMDQRQDGTLEETEEEHNLYQLYLSVLHKNGCDPNGIPRIGTAFLRKNKYFLDL